MTGYGWLTLLSFGVLLAISTPLLGNYMAKVYGNRAAPGDRFFLPIENFVYRVCRIDPESEQRWRTYVMSLLVFTLFGMVFTYVILRIQYALRVIRTIFLAVSPALAFNTAVSFGTNTNWTNYTGEATMSQLSQIIGLVWHQFISAAVGMALAAAFIRAIIRRRRNTLGNFWVDTVRSTTRVLIPLSFVFAIVLMSQGVIDNFHASTAVTTVAAQATHNTKSAALQQTIPGGPVASMTPIEMLGDNGGGYFGANAGHPLENPNGFTNIIILWLTAMIPFAFCWTYGRMVGSMRQGRMVLTVMTVMFAISVLIVVPLEQRGNTKLNVAGVTQKATATNPGGNLEGKDLRLGAVGNSLNAADVTATSTGGTSSAHESYTPLGGSIPLFNMMLGEVIPGGTGTGLFGMLIFVLITVFIAGLMVGRTPSYLGKQILAPDMKLAAIYILVLPTTVLILAGIAVVLPVALKSVSTSAPHGLTEVVYAYTSSAHNNGSAFGGLTGNVPWYNITLAIAMFFGRFFEIIPALALAGSLVRKRTFAVTAGTVRTDTPLFTFLVIAVVFVLVGLTYFPALALGPLAEQLSGHFGI